MEEEDNCNKTQTKKKEKPVNILRKVMTYEELRIKMPCIFFWEKK